MLWIELESDRTKDSLNTDVHYAEGQLTDPVCCYLYTEHVTTDTDNGPETDDGENILNVIFQ